MIRIIGISFTEGNDQNPEQSFSVHADTHVTAAIVPSFFVGNEDLRLSY